MPEELRLEEEEREGDTEPDGQGVTLRDRKELAEEEACRVGLAEALGERDTVEVSVPPIAASGAPVAVAPRPKLAEGEGEGDAVTLGQAEWVPLPRALELTLALPDSEPEAPGEGLAEALREPPPGEPLPEALKEGEELELPEREGEWEEEMEEDTDRVGSGEWLEVGELEGGAVALVQLEGVREAVGEWLLDGQAEGHGEGVGEGELDRLSVAVALEVDETEAVPVTLRVPAATLLVPRAEAELVEVEQGLTVRVPDWDCVVVVVALMLTELQGLAELQGLGRGEPESDSVALPEPDREGDCEPVGESSGEGEIVALPEVEADGDAEAVAACSARGRGGRPAATASPAAPAAASAAAPLWGVAGAAASTRPEVRLRKVLATQAWRVADHAGESGAVGAGASSRGAALCAAAPSKAPAASLCEAAGAGAAK